jgi:hypothetical protein
LHAAKEAGTRSNSFLDPKPLCIRIVETLHNEMRKLASIRKQVKATNFKARNLYRKQSSIEEVAEVIVRPNSYAGASNVGEIDIGQEVLAELKDYVAAIADMYHVSPTRHFRIVMYL